MRFILPEETVLLFEKLKRDTVAKALPLVFYSVLKGTDEPTEGLDDGTKIAFELAMHHIRKRERKNARQRRYDVTSVSSDARYDITSVSSDARKEEGEKKKGLPPHPPYKENKEGEVKEPTQTLPLADEIRLFQMFWEAYPRKVAKVVAEDAFHKTVSGDKDPVGLVNRMIAALEVQKKDWNWVKDEGRFIPHPTTWLNQRRWEDVVTSQSPETETDNIAKELMKELNQ